MPIDNNNPTPPKNEDFKEMDGNFGEEEKCSAEKEEFKKELCDEVPKEKGTDLERVEGFTMEELRKELEAEGLLEVQEKEMQILASIQEERRQLREERERFAAEMSSKLDVEEKKARGEAAKKAETEAKKRIQIFAKERRKWRTLERARS